MCSRPAITLALGLTLVLMSSVSWAQDGVDIEFVEGPVLGSNRIVGLGGAFVSVSEGADAHLLNPASFAMRYPWARDAWMDWDWSVYWLNDSPGDASNPDLAREAKNLGGTFLIGGGIDLRMSGVGMGAHVRSRSADFVEACLEPTEDKASCRYRLAQTIGGLGFGFLFREPQVAVGVGLMSASVSLARVNDDNVAQDLLSLKGGGISLGSVWAPEGERFRLGAEWRSPILVADVEVPAPDGLVTQQISGLHVPGRFSAGGSVMIWDRMYNPTFTMGSKHAPPVDQRISPNGRRYVLFAADLTITGASENAISSSSYLDGSNESSGADVTYSPKAGVESEFWANEMRARTGSYYEPSRVESRRGRFHWTFGMDYRIHVWTDWRLNAVIDIAPGYLNWGLGIGFWN